MAGLRGKALIAYLLVCLVWGSTYLFIRIGVDHHLPPFLFAGMRFLTAGLLLGASVTALGIRLPSRTRDWRILAITGVLFLCGANAMVVWAEQYVASGIASVLVSAMPLWSALFDAALPGGKTPVTWRLAVGLAVGFAGTALLAGITPDQLAAADLRGPIALTFGSACWALGSIYWKRNPTTDVSPYAAASVQMAIAGALLCVFGLAIGEAPRFQLDGAAIGAMAYLILIGSIVGYTAFGYALEYGSAAVVGTYAYVNPVVAVLLGWLVLDEPITGRMLVAMALILGSVLWIQLAGRPGVAPARPARALERRRPADAA
jgi:drug/metabolite transporter (DMT)-like permease